MDIERLKELKGLVALNTWMSERAKKELTELIDEAIARQSVKSEEVQEAIEVINKKIYAHKEFIRQAKITNMAINLLPHYVKIKSLDLAISALQAYEPTTRKDRTVEEVAISKTETTSCEWCELEPSEKIFAYGMGFRKMPSNFCPNCGRKLN